MLEIETRLDTAQRLMSLGHPAFGNRLMHGSGSYVRVVNLEARVFDPLLRLKLLIDAQGR